MHNLCPINWSFKKHYFIQFHIWFFANQNLERGPSKKHGSQVSFKFESLSVMLYLHFCNNKKLTKFQLLEGKKKLKYMLNILQYTYYPNFPLFQYFFLAVMIILRKLLFLVKADGRRGRQTQF